MHRLVPFLAACVLGIVTYAPAGAQDGGAVRVLEGRYPHVQPSQAAYGLAVLDNRSVYVVGTEFRGYETGVQVFLLRYNRLGRLLWRAEFGGSGGDYPRAMAVDDAGNVYVAAQSEMSSASGSRAMATVKFDAQGERQWVRYHDGRSRDAPVDLFLDDEGRIYVLGTAGFGEFPIVAYDADGEELWSRVFDGGSNDAVPGGIAVDEDGRVYVASTAVGSSGTLDHTVVKYGIFGQEWVRTYDFNGGEEGATVVALDSRGDVVAAGWDGDRFLTIKYTGSGLVRWRDTYVTFGDGRVERVRIGPGDDVYVGGTIAVEDRGESNMLIVRYSPSGEALVEYEYDEGPRQSFNPIVFRDFTIDDDGNVYAVGHKGIDEPEAIVTVKFDVSGLREWVRTYPGSSDGIQRAEGIALDADGQVIVTATSHGRGADVATLAYDASGELLWRSRYSGEVGYFAANDVTVGVDGSIYLAGRGEYEESGSDFTIVKRDSTWGGRWARTYDGPAGEDDWAERIALTGDAVYVAGTSTGSGSERDFAVLSLDEGTGEMRWVARIDGPAGGQDRLADLAVDDEGNAYVTGATELQSGAFAYATAKINANGQIEWVRRYGGETQLADGGTAVAVDAEGNAYVTGVSRVDVQTSEYATIKYDPDGREQWVARYGAPEGGYSRAAALAMDGDFVYVSGVSAQDIVTIRYTVDGEETWMDRYDDPAGGYDAAHAIAVDDEGNAIVTGISQGGGTGLDYTTIKYDRDGDRRWVSVYDGPGNDVDRPWALAVDGAGEVYVTGESVGELGDRDFATVKYDAEGARLWTVRHDYNDSDDRANALALDGRGNVYVAGYAGDSGTWGLMNVVKYAQPDFEPTDSEQPVPSVRQAKLAAYPNPFAERAVIEFHLPRPGRATVAVFDLLGRRVARLADGAYPAGRHNLTWHRSDLAPGVYFVRLRTDYGVRVRRAVAAPR